MKIIAGSDHGGLSLKRVLIERMRGQGHEVVDAGTDSSASCDYPDYAVIVARSVAAGEAQFGLLVCGTGQGMAMAANRVPGIRAAVVCDTFTAHATREHNDANVLCLGGRMLGELQAKALVSVFLATPFAGGRHAARVAKIESGAC